MCASICISIEATALTLFAHYKTPLLFFYKPGDVSLSEDALSLLPDNPKLCDHIQGQSLEWLSTLMTRMLGSVHVCYIHGEEV